MVQKVERRGRGRPAQGQSPVTQDEILERAFHAFAMYGYDGVSLRTLSRELGVSHGLLTQRFGTKEALWFAAVDHVCVPFAAAMNGTTVSDADALSKVRASLRAFASLSAESPDVFRLVNSEGSIPGKRLDHLVEVLIAPTLGPSYAAYKELMDKGIFRRIPHPTLFFITTCGTAAVYSNDALASKLFGAQGEPADKAAHADAVADLILEGLLVQRG